VPGATACLTEDQVLAFFEGRLGSETRGTLELHIDGCVNCRMWLSAVAQTLELSGDAGRILGAGARLGGRYRIERFLAAGGMGEVYEATDEALGVRVALKRLGLRVVGNDRAIDRLRREVQLARRVTHPNVCRVFDLGEADGEIFLTMELLSGQSLAERLADAPLPAAEARAIAGQIAGALDAAHAAGVIHRDLKSSNVMLVPDAGGIRAVVTDFGLARADAVDSSLSEPGAMLGSPAYMAPEQVRGDEVGPAADRYAFGVVLFEMATRRRPFGGSTAVETALARLAGPAPSPRALAPSLSRAWERATLACLESAPSRRPPSGAAILSLLDGRSPPSRTWTWTWTWMWATALVLIIAAMVPFGWRLWHRGSHTAARTGVALLGLRDLNPKDASGWIGAALVELLASELGQSPDLRVCSRDDVARMQAGLGSAASAPLAVERLGAARAQLAADWLISGSYLVSGDVLRIDLTIQDARTGTAAALPYTGRASDLLELVARTGGGLREQLGVTRRRNDAEQVRASFPRTAAAGQVYADALARIRNYDLWPARTLLRRVVELEPDFAPAHAALAEVCRGRGLEVEARVEAQRALTLLRNPSREERLQLEAQLRRLEHDWPRAIAIYQALTTFYPDELAYGLNLARAQIEGGRSADAEATVTLLRKLPSPLGDDPRIDLCAAQAAAKQGDWQRRLELTERAIVKGRSRGAQLLVADGQTGAAQAELYLGHPDRAQSRYEEAARIFSAAGDRRGAITASTGIAEILEQAGDLAGARPRYQAAVDFFQHSGSPYDLADAENALAQLVGEQGALAEAEAIYVQAAHGFAAASDREGMGNVASNRGDLLLARGQAQAAIARYREALVLLEQVGMKTHVAGVRSNLADALRRTGDFAQAESLSRQSIADLRAIHDSEQLYIRLHQRGVLLTDREDPAAQATLAEALALARSEGGLADAAIITGALGRLALASPDPSFDLHALEAARDLLTRAGRKDDAALAGATLARLYESAGRLDEAERAVALATQAAAGSEVLDAQVYPAATRARLAARRRACAFARTTLDQALAVARAADVRDTLWQLRVDDAEVRSLCVGQAAARRAELARDAKRAGFLRIARLASH
jgi:tetratricopeptide (TPR) repeat protein